MASLCTYPGFFPCTDAQQSTSLQSTRLPQRYPAPSVPINADRQCIVRLARHFNNYSCPSSVANIPANCTPSLGRELTAAPQHFPPRLPCIPCCQWLCFFCTIQTRPYLPLFSSPLFTTTGRYEHVSCTRSCSPGTLRRISSLYAIPLLKISHTHYLRSSDVRLFVNDDTHRTGSSTPPESLTLAYMIWDISQPLESADYMSLFRFRCCCCCYLALYAP